MTFKASVDPTGAGTGRSGPARSRAVSKDRGRNTTSPGFVLRLNVGIPLCREPRRWRDRLCGGITKSAGSCRPPAYQGRGGDKPLNSSRKDCGWQCQVIRYMRESEQLGRCPTSSSALLPATGR